MRGIKIAVVVVAGVAGALLLGSAASATTFAAVSPVDPCEAYVYVGTSQNLCADFPEPDDRNCPEIAHKVRLVGSWDPWGLDRDKDSYGCNTYPLKSGVSPSPSSSLSPSPSSSPRVSSSPPASATPSIWASTASSALVVSNSSATAAPPGTFDDELVLTGSSVWSYGLIALILLVVGGGLFYITRSRSKTNFKA